MSHRTDGDEVWALRLLNQIIDCDRRNSDALPGSVVKLVKAARRKLIKLQKAKRSSSGRRNPPATFLLPMGKIDNFLFLS